MISRAFGEVPALAPLRPGPADRDAVVWLFEGLVRAKYASGLRKVAAHPKHRRSAAARAAANLLKTRFFAPDSYPSYKSAEYWVRFQYPFWWNNLVAALDSLSLIGVPCDDPHIQHGLEWLIDHQQRSGLWKLSYEKRKAHAQPANADQMQLWVTLAICRILKRYFG